MNIEDDIMHKIYAYSSISSCVYGFPVRSGLTRMPNEKKVEIYGACSPALISAQNPMFGDGVSLIYFCHLYAKVLKKEENIFEKQICAR